MPETSQHRIIFWNIDHGGGERAGEIIAQVKAWKPDSIAFAEFRGTNPSQSIAAALQEAGYSHQLTTVDADNPAWNAMCLASRYPLTRIRIVDAPLPEQYWDLYWLLARVHTTPALHVGAVHVPWSNRYGRLDFYAAMLHIAEHWQYGPGVIIGDTNTGITSRDELTVNSDDYFTMFMDPMAKCGWRDMFRAFHPVADALTWYSSYRGLRLDQAFVNADLQAQVKTCWYDWGTPESHPRLSDHATVLLDLNLSP